jgi:hypothetical protein
LSETIAEVAGGVDGMTKPPTMCLQLFGGRPRPDSNVDETDGGVAGPRLEIAWVHITCGEDWAIGLPDGSEFYIDRWEFGKRDGMMVEGFLHYDGMFHGDWELYPAHPDMVPFDPDKAVFPKDTAWADRPCFECGLAMFVDPDGISHHAGDGPDGIDHDMDADHVAY